MYKSSFGSIGQVQFANEHEYYKLLGYLAKSDGSTSLAWEHNENQGAWGSEGRIQVHITNMPTIGQLKLTAGNGGGIFYRINCNEFVENLNINHGFVYGGIQNAENIRQTVPASFIKDFDDGFNL